MPSIIQQRDTLIAEAKAIAQRAKDAGKNLTSGDMSAIKVRMDQVADLNGRIAEEKAGHDLWAKITGAAPAGIDNRLHLGFGERFADQLASKVIDPSAKAVLPSSSTQIPTEFISTIHADPQRPLTLLDVIPTEVRQAPVFTYLRGIGHTGGAAPVATAQLKPSLTPALEAVTGKLEVIALTLGWIDRFWLQDLPTVKQWVTDEITYSIRSGLENQIINGTGVDPNLSGFLTTSGIQTCAWDTNALVTLRRAAAKLQNLGYQTSAYVLNPDDWADVELTRQVNSGQPDFSSTPVNLAEQRVWSTPVVTTTSIAVGTGLLLGVGSSQLNVAQEGLLVDWTEGAAYDATSTAFQRNLLLFRGEMRAEHSVFRPDAVVKIDLVNPGP